MSIASTVTNALNHLKRQYVAFAQIRSRRSFFVRSRRHGSLVQHPDWQLIFVVTLSIIMLALLFADGAMASVRAQIPQDLQIIFQKITRLGKSELLLVPSGVLVLGLGLMPWGILPNSLRAVICRFQMLGLFVFVAIAGSGITNNILKMIVGRARPKYFDQFGAFHFDAPGLSYGFQSFPSGHSATAGAIAMVLILLVPRFKWIWLAFGVWIAVSRVVVGAHYPSDIVAGFVYGATFTWLFAKYCADRRFLFRARDGLIRLPHANGLSFSQLYKALHMLAQRA